MTVETLKENWTDKPDKYGYYWLIIQEESSEILVYVDSQLKEVARVSGTNNGFAHYHWSTINQITGKWLYINLPDKEDIINIKKELDIKVHEKTKERLELELVDIKDKLNRLAAN